MHTEVIQLTGPNPPDTPACHGDKAPDISGTCSGSQISILAAAMAKGDKTAFDQLIHLCYSKALRTAYLICGSRADSEDIVQESFVLCWVKRNTLQSPEYFETWFFRILTREAWRCCRKARREIPAEEIISPQKADSQSVSDEAMKKWEAFQIWTAVGKLPLKQRTTVILYYYSQMSTREIATAMGCLEGTVKSRLHTARKALKQVLADIPEY